MIGRALPGSGFAINIARAAFAGQGRACQNQVDTEPGIAAKPGSTVVPPAKSLLWLLELAEYVTQTQIQQGLERRAFCRTTQDVVTPTSPGYERLDRPARY